MLERVTPHLTRVSARRARRGLPAPQILVTAGDDTFSWGDQDARFHSASVGKLATAVVIMRLVDAGALSLSTRVFDVLGDQPGLFLGSPTVGQLLNHTSGAADYFNRPFQNLVVSSPDRAWTPLELVDYSRVSQHPVGAPGERFHYSDTGYVLLGLIAETVTGASWGSLLRTHVIDPLGMSRTSLFALGDTTAPVWIGRHEVSTAASLTCDWAGGGLLTTLDDLILLSRGWRGLVSPDAVAMMSSFTGRFRSGLMYGSGLMEARFEGFMPLLRGLPRPTGHLGITSVHLWHFDGADIAMNFHSTREMVSSFQVLIRLVQALGARATSPQQVGAGTSYPKISAGL